MTDNIVERKWYCHIRHWQCYIRLRLLHCMDFHIQGDIVQSGKYGQEMFKNWLWSASGYTHRDQVWCGWHAAHYATLNYCGCGQLDLWRPYFWGNPLKIPNPVSHLPCLPHTPPTPGEDLGERSEVPSASSPPGGELALGNVTRTWCLVLIADLGIVSQSEPSWYSYYEM